MIWQQLKVLVPSMFVHWVLTVALCVGVWYALKKFVQTFTWHWEAFVAIGTAVSLYHSVNTVTNYFQNGKLQERQAQLQQEAQTVAVQEELKMREEFLKNIDALAKDPSLATAENKQRLQQAFPAVFQNPQVRDAYLKNVSNLLMCQKVFLEDAVASREKGQAVKSKDRETCEQLGGEFFNRAKLVPDEVRDQNNQLIVALSQSRSPASADQKLPSTEELKNSVKAADVAVQIVHAMFQP